MELVGLKLVPQQGHRKEVDLKLGVMLNMEMEKCVGIKMVLENR